MKYLLIIYFFSFFSGAYYFDVGFALKIFIIFSVVLVVINFNKIRFSFHLYEYFMLLFFFLYISTSFFAIDYLSSLRLTVGIVLLITVYLLLKFLFDTYSKRFNLEYLLFYSLILFVVLSLIMYALGLGVVNGEFLKYNTEKIYGVMIDRHIPRLIGLTEDPNFFALYITPFLFYFYVKKSKTIKDVILLFLLFLLLFLSFSRGAIIGVFGVIFIYELIKLIFIFSNLPKRISLRKYIPLIAAIFIFIFIFIFISSYMDIVDKVLEMINKRVSTASSGSGRFEIWSNGLDLFQDNFFTGIGLYNFRYYNLHYFNDAHYMHNTHLEVLVEAGIIGFTVYVVFHLLLFYQLVKICIHNKTNIYLLLSYMSMIIQLSVLSAIINEVWFLFLAYIAFIIKVEKLKRLKYEV